jgi:hypothetical protein
MIDDDCEAIGGMRIRKGNRSTGENLPLCPPQIPHDLTRARTRAAAVGSQQRHGLMYAIYVCCLLFQRDSECHSYEQFKQFDRISTSFLYGVVFLICNKLLFILIQGAQK